MDISVPFWELEMNTFTFEANDTVALSRSEHSR
jgi:hypothetical protein